MNGKHTTVILSQAAWGKSSMATTKKGKSPGAAPVQTPANKLNGKAISARASGTPEARDTARLLLDIEAIHCRPDNPYIFTSGRASPARRAWVLRSAATEAAASGSSSRR